MKYTKYDFKLAFNSFLAKMSDLTSALIDIPGLGPFLISTGWLLAEYQLSLISLLGFIALCLMFYYGLESNRLIRESAERYANSKKDASGQ